MAPCRNRTVYYVEVQICTTWLRPSRFSRWLHTQWVSKARRSPVVTFRIALVSTSLASKDGNGRGKPSMELSRTALDELLLKSHERYVKYVFRASII